MMRMHRCALLARVAGLATALFIAPLFADTKVDFTANVLRDTCQIEADGNGTVTFATVGPSYFADGITAETDYRGGKEFVIKLVSCPASDGQITFEFTPQSGQFPAGNKQVFPNDLTPPDGGVENVGVAIFTNSSPRVNVLNTDGSARATFTAPTYSDTSWTFYARMQKILSAEGVGTGMLRSKVLVNVYYQ